MPSTKPPCRQSQNRFPSGSNVRILLKNSLLRNSRQKIGTLFFEAGVWQTLFEISPYSGRIFCQTGRHRSNIEFFNTISAQQTLALPFCRKHLSESVRCPLRAHCGSVYFSLHALAACELLREQGFWCRRISEKPAIHSDRSEDQASNSQLANNTAFLLPSLNFRSRQFTDVF